MTERILLGIILAGAIYLFWTQKLRTDLTAILVLLTLIIPWPHGDGEWRGILDYQEGFSGFGSAAVIMVTAMFIFGGALVKTGAAEFIALRLFRAVADKEWLLQAAILTTTVFTSMFVNDTTVVLVFLPILMSICRERKRSPSRYLMAAAYGSLLGGQWTLVGTRSNLIISDYYKQQTGASFGFFDFAPVAAVIFVAALVYFVLVGQRFLPHHGRAGTKNGDREYLSEVMVTAKSKSVGKSLQDLGWTQRKDLDVIEILRGQKTISLRDALQAGDLLIMRGASNTLGEVLKSPDFQLKEEIKMNPETLQSVDLVTVEALLPPNSGYAGSTLNELEFKRVYGFSVLGIARHGRTIRKRPMTTRLAYGDALLLLGQTERLPRLRRNRNLIVLVEESIPAVGKRKAFVALSLLIGVITLAVTDALSPVIAVPVAAFLAIVLGCIRVQDAYNAIDWPAVVTVAGMIPFGVAMEKTGVAADLAQSMVQVFAGLGPLPLLASVLLLAILLTQVIENAAVAIILAPLVFGVAQEIGVNPKTFLIALAICVSAGFCTPFAHESTILVMGPGQYRFKHYLQTGTVLAMITWIVATLLTPLIWPLDGR